jgi:cephalosporin hydroxylase
MNFSEFVQPRRDCPPADFEGNPIGFNRLGDNVCSFSDMSAHLPILQYFASLCNHCTEFGTRRCCSTIALLQGAKSKVVSYDVAKHPDITTLENIEDKPCTWQFKLQDTTDPNHQIETTDFLFVDTLHTYEQVKKELELHADQVGKFIAFHDTTSQGTQSLDVPGAEGILRAIHEFLVAHPEWKPIYEARFNHGLIIVQKEHND